MKPVALITGGSKGIGLETVRRFVQRGYQVITCARNPQTWTEVIEAEPQLAAVAFHALDLTDQSQVEEFFQHIQTTHGTLQVAVNNASPEIATLGRYADLPADALLATWQSDFWAHALCLRLELTLINRGGAIVNVSSVNGLRPTPRAAMYGAAKHGLEGLTRSLALEAIEQGVRINAVAPGITWTPRWQARCEKEADPGFREQVASQVPLGRFAETAEVVNAIDWLCSAQASYVVGHTLVVDGGLSLK